MAPEATPALIQFLFAEEVSDAEIHRQVIEVGGRTVTPRQLMAK